MERWNTEPQKGDGYNTTTLVKNIMLGARDDNSDHTENSVVGKDWTITLEEEAKVN